MKKLAIFAAVALSAAFTPFKAPAQNLILNVSGTIKEQGEDTALKGTLISMSLNEKSVYALITNAVAGNDGLGILGTNITPVTLPADGYIAFSTNLDAGGYPGTFYVTNKAGFHYPLSNLDATNGYYSFIELDTYVYFGDDLGFDVDFGSPFSDIASDNLSSSTGNGSGTGVSTGVLYIHDNPYAYDDADNPDILAGYYLGYSYPENNNAIEIRGIVTTPLKFTAGVQRMSSFSLTGTGNAMLDGDEFSSLVSSGHMTLVP